MALADQRIKSQVALKPHGLFEVRDPFEKVLLREPPLTQKLSLLVEKLFGHERVVRGLEVVPAPHRRAVRLVEKVRFVEGRGHQNDRAVRRGEHGEEHFQDHLLGSESYSELILRDRPDSKKIKS